jgi:hypothetical protein
MLAPRNSRAICAWNMTDLKKYHMNLGLASKLNLTRMVKSLATAGNSPSNKATLPKASPERLMMTSPGCNPTRLLCSSKNDDTTS